jgi:hypothetical protein
MHCTSHYSPRVKNIHTKSNGESSRGSLGERDLDRALESFLSHPRFRERFLAAIGERGLEAAGGLFIGARRSGSTRGGQTDVVAEWEGASRKLVVLIESKLNAGFQPRQGERYKERSVRLVASGWSVKTVLVAPRAYLATANVQATLFEYRLAVEDLVDWIMSEIGGVSPELYRLVEALQRVQDSMTLGAKGLYREFHAAVEAECRLRNNGFSIRNKATRVLYITFPGAAPGVALKYRAHTRTPELFIGKAFKGSRSELETRAAPGILIVHANTEMFVRIADSPFQGVDTPEPKADEVVDALERLLTWWLDVALDERG